MKIIAYKCPDTNRLFENKAEYDKHRRKVLADIRKKRAQDDMLDTFNKIIADFRSSTLSWDERGAWICNNTDVFVSRAKLLHKTRSISNLKFTRVMFNVNYKEHCSNSHCSPLNGVTNWWRTAGLPMSYPGWYGRIEFSFTGDYSGFFSELFDGTGLNCGTGGGGYNSYGCEITLFEGDWPALKELRVFNYLSQ
jgi:hypothetical protein